MILVLLNMQTFCYSHFIFLARVVVEIEKIIKKFLWSRKEMKASKAKVA